MAFRMAFLFWIKCQNALHQILFVCYNYRSPLSNQSEEENQIKAEINGNYVISKIKTFIVSALGSLPTDNGSVRLIYGANMPMRKNYALYIIVYLRCLSIKEALVQVELKIHACPFVFKITGKQSRFHII